MCQHRVSFKPSGTSHSTLLLCVLCLVRSHDGTLWHYKLKRHIKLFMRMVRMVQTSQNCLSSTQNRNFLFEMFPGVLNIKSIKHEV